MSPSCLVESDTGTEASTDRKYRSIIHKAAEWGNRFRERDGVDETGEEEHGRWWWSVCGWRCMDGASCEPLDPGASDAGTRGA